MQRFVKGKKTGTEQYDECAKLLQGGAKIKIIIDVNTYPSVPHDGYMHSQDQGFKSGSNRNKYNKLSKKFGTRVIIVRFCDTTQEKQLSAGTSTNSFSDGYFNFSK